MRLKNKGRYGMDSCECNFVVETKEDFDRLSSEYPGKVLLCDRTFVLDTRGHDSVEGTKELHEVRSTATSIPSDHPRAWPATISSMPCNCVHCIVDPRKNSCKYRAWRRTRDTEIKIECVYPEEATSWIGKGIAKERSGKTKFEIGVILTFDIAKRKWGVKCGNNSIEMWTYTQISTAMKHYSRIKISSIGVRGLSGNDTTVPEC